MRSRLDSVGAGWRLVLIMAAAAWGYCAATWDEPQRLTIAALFAAGALLSLFTAFGPTERLVRSRWCDPFFLGWSLLQVVVIAVAVTLDGGAESPLALLFFLPLLYAALSYPVPSVVTVGALTEVAYVTSALAGGWEAQVQLGFFSVCLACAAVVCALDARNSERRRLELSRVSRTDPLTGAFNRRGFAERLEAELAHGGRQGRPLALIVLDLDDFKAVNDQDGHAAGDEVLCRVVDELQDEMRPNDVVGRLGGDEFGLLLPGAVRSDALEAAERIRIRLAHRAPVSAGVAACPEDGTDSETLHHHADHELDEDKAGPGLGHEPGRTMELSWATAFAGAVDMRMACDHAHSFTVANRAAGIGQMLGLPPENVENLRLAGVLHDIGKVTVPDRILRKPGPLTPDEFVLMAEHPIIGSRMLRRIEGMEDIADWVLHSHEHMDGSGYPDGLAGAEIPLEARILLVADAYDAMTSDRPYRTGLGHDHAMGELPRLGGMQFDPACVTALAEYLAGAVAPSDEALL
ncbi:MAG: bifunctional diguanylate cyclase/phosphohydrolase [Solirubrobacteraceae bacterium]